MSTGTLVGFEVAVVDPLIELFLPGQIGLQAASVERVETPGRIGEALVSRIDFVRGVADQDAAQLTAQRQRVTGAVKRML